MIRINKEIKSSYYSILLLMVVSFLTTLTTSVKADTLSSLLTDVIADVIVTPLSKTCLKNPYLLSSTGVHLVTPCPALVPPSPIGNTQIPGITKCTTNPNANDATIQFRINQVNEPWRTSLKLNFEEKHTNNSLSCNVDAQSIWFGMPSLPSYNRQEVKTIGYTPFCFFDMSKIKMLTAGQKRWAQPRYNEIDPALLVTMTSGDTVSFSELQNPAYWVCSVANYSATARSTLLPAGFIEHLGIK